MTRLFINSPFDMPHRPSDLSPLVAACKRSLVGAKPITDKQALVYLGDRRCHECFPGWTPHNLLPRRSAA